MSATETILEAPPATTDRDDLRIFASTGDPEAFARLTHRYLNVVYSFCRRQLGDGHLAEDATQAVFILLSRNARSIKPGVIVSGWLFNTARYCCANAKRSEMRRVKHESEAAKLRQAEANTVSIAIDPHQSEELNAALNESLAQLRSGDRDVLLLRYFEQRSHREMSRMLGISEDAAKSRLLRALRRLRSKMTRGDVSAGAIAALPTWLEHDAIGSAPAHLAETAHSTKAIQLAKATETTMRINSILVIAKTILLGTAVVGAAVVAPVALQGTATPVSLNAPATMPAKPPMAQIDLSTPIASLRSLSAAIRSSDFDGISRSVILPDNDEGKMALASIHMSAAQNRVNQVISTHFGPTAPHVNFTWITADQLIDRALDMMKPDDLRIEGTHATMTLHYPEQMLNQTPDLRIFEGAEMQLTHTGDNWKFDVLDSLVFVQQDRAKNYSKADPVHTRAYYEVRVELVDALAKKIESGKVPSALPLNNQFHQDLNTVLAERHLDDIAQTLSLPKAAFQKLMQSAPAAGGRP